MDSSIGYIEDDEEALRSYIYQERYELFFLRASTSDIFVALRHVFRLAKFELIKKLLSKFNIFIAADEDDILTCLCRFNFERAKEMNALSDGTLFAFFKKEVVKSACFRGCSLDEVERMVKE